MNEAQFKRDFMKKWQTERPAIFRHNISDLQFTSREYYKNQCSVDILLGYPPEGTLIGIEWKLTKTASISVSSIRPIQIRTLQAINRCGGHGLFMIGCYRPKTRKKQVYALPVEVIIDLCDTTIEDLERKSIPLTIIPDTYLITYKDLRWDIVKLERIIFDVTGSKFIT